MILFPSGAETYGKVGSKHLVARSSFSFDTRQESNEGRQKVDMTVRVMQQHGEVH